MFLPKKLMRKTFLLITTIIVIVTFIIINLVNERKEAYEKRLKSIEYQAETTNICNQNKEEYISICKAIANLQKVYYKKYDFVVNYYDFKPWPTSPMCSRSTEVVILINSRPENSEWRRTVRKTFGSVAIGKPWPDGKIYTMVQILFLVGKTYDYKRDSLLTDEADLWKDMVIGNFKDHLLNDTIKTLMGLEWTYWKCSPMTHFVKVEENIIINIPNLLNAVKSAAETGKGIVGSIRRGELVSRTGALGLPVQTFPFHVLPIHLSSHIYIITAPAVKQLLESSRYVRWLPLENVYFTGILPRIALIPIGHHPGLNYDLVHPCDLKEKSSKFVAGKVSEKDVDSLWKRFLDTIWTCQNGKLYHL